MQNYDGQFKLNGQEYFYKAKDDSGSSKITRVNNEEHHYRMVEITNKETNASLKQKVKWFDYGTDEKGRKRAEGAFEFNIRWLEPLR